MKKTIVLILILFTCAPAMAQWDVGAGLKAGANFAKMSFNADDYTAESIVKSHWGIYGRLGHNRLFLQPEFYFSAKGGKFSSNLFQVVTAFDYTSVDVPLLLGCKIVNGENASLYVLAGPTFNFLTAKRITGDDLLSPQYYNDHYLGFQYGVGADLWFLTVGARMEHSKDNIYSHPNLQGKSQTFMLTVGVRIL